MESLAAHVHAYLLHLRLDEAEREERAQVRLETKRRGGDEGQRSMVIDAASR
jgi:hypothetical protein